MPSEFLGADGNLTEVIVILTGTALPSIGGGEGQRIG